jgi:3-phosphoshikimate 1-carboxyvinyltransferase
MKTTIFPGATLHGTLERELPGDKSISHRAALFAALAEGRSEIRHFQVSGVTRPMLQALTALKVAWSLDGDTLSVTGKGVRGLHAPSFPIDCGNSATTLRLLAGVLAAAGLPAVLEGTPGLKRRPMGRIVAPLQQMGVPISASPDGCAPLRLQGRLADSSLQAQHLILPVASAQVKSCLLLAGLGCEGTTRIDEPGPSRDHTERMLQSMGVIVRSEVREGINCVSLCPPRPLELTPLHLNIPGDPSAAAFLIVAALITAGSELHIQNICLNPTRTGLIEVLQEMGGVIEVVNQHIEGGEPCGDVCVRSSHLHGTSVSGERVVRMIDEFPIFAVAAAAAQGESMVSDAAELRLKESDRISVLAKELRILGVEITEQADGFSLRGGKIQGGSVDAHGDHRLAMSLLVAGLISTAPVTVLGSECSAESFPGFADLLRSLGARLTVEQTL